MARPKVIPADVVKDHDLLADPGDWRLLHLPTDTIYRFDGASWVPLAHIHRVDIDMGEDLIIERRPKKR